VAIKAEQPLVKLARPIIIYLAFEITTSKQAKGFNSKPYLCNDV